MSLVFTRVCLLGERVSLSTATLSLLIVERPAVLIRAILFAQLEQSLTTLQLAPGQFDLNPLFKDRGQAFGNREQDFNHWSGTRTYFRPVLVLSVTSNSDDA